MGQVWRSECGGQDGEVREQMDRSKRASSLGKGSEEEKLGVKQGLEEVGFHFRKQLPSEGRQVFGKLPK